MRTLLPRHLAVAALLAASSPAAGDEPPGFGPGEQLDYAVEYLGIRTGRAHVVVGRAEGSVWPVICQARTDGIAGILDIREHYVSYWDSGRKLPRGSDLAAIELGDRHSDSARFDRVLGRATVQVQRRGRLAERSYEIPPDAQDPGGAVLRLRVHPLAPGVHLEIPVFTGSRVFTLIADVLDRETVSTPAGRFDALRVKVRTAFQGKFSTTRDTFIWFSDDARRVPLRVSADFAVGSVVATLTAYRAGGEVARR